MSTSDPQLQRAGLKPMAHLPNREGFRFIGRRRDGTESEYVVARNTLTGQHVVAGFSNLVGWRDK